MPATVTAKLLDLLEPHIPDDFINKHWQWRRGLRLRQGRLAQNLSPPCASGIPSHATSNRLFAALKPGAFLDCFLRWIQSLRPRARQGHSPRSIVTLDATSCQKSIAREIIEADYVLALKANQETAHEEVKSFLDDAMEQQAAVRSPACGTPRPSGKRIDKDHGRLDWFEDRSKWEGLRSVGMVEAERTAGGKTTIQRRYYLTSLPLGVETFARAVRGHWGVANQLHWVFDVQMGEDKSQVRIGPAAENLATLRRLALNLLKSDKTKKRGIWAKQLNAGWNRPYLLKLLAF